MQADLGDVVLDYQVIGEGDPVVLVCGAGQPAIGWQVEVVPALTAAGFSVLVFDSRGVPPSSSPPAPYTVAQMATDTLRLADHVGWDRFSVAGYSLGGWVAEQIAMTRPERVQAAVFIGSLNRGTAWERAVTTVERDLAASEVELPELFDAVHTLRYLPNHELQDDAVVDTWLPLLGGDPWENPGRLGQLEACLAWTLDVERTTRWASCPVPCLVVAFEHDVDSPPARAREAAAELPDARFIEIAGASHLGPFTHGAALCDAMVPFLTEHRS